MEKTVRGVYKMSFGTPENHTYVGFREYPAKAVGEDCAPPFTEADITFDVSRDTERQMYNDAGGISYIRQTVSVNNRSVRF